MHGIEDRSLSVLWRDRSDPYRPGSCTGERRVSHPPIALEVVYLSFSNRVSHYLSMRRRTSDTQTNSFRRPNPRGVLEHNRQMSPRPPARNTLRHKGRDRGPGRIRQEKQGVPKTEGPSDPIDTISCKAERSENPTNKKPQLYPRPQRETPPTASTNNRRAHYVIYQTVQHTLEKSIL